MTKLSWLIYIAEVIGKVETVLSVVLLVMAAVTFVYSFISIPETEYGEYFSTHKNFFKCVILAALPVVLLLIVIPSRATIYAMATVEYGSAAVEDLSKSPYTAKAKALLDKWIDEQLTEEQK